jgi:hypothetical protein
MATPSRYQTQGFKLYRKTDVEPLFYEYKDFEDDEVRQILCTIKQNIDQGISLNLKDVISSGGSLAADERHRSEGLYSFADIQRKRQESWDF